MLANHILVSFHAAFISSPVGSRSSSEILLGGRRALVLGYGAIGARIARACEGLGMNVRAVRRRPTGDEAHACSTLDDLDGLLEGTHALLVALPWTGATEGLLGRDRLAKLPGGCCIVNVGRGPIVDEDALYAELASGRLRAGLDVWYHYPKSEQEREQTPPSRHDFGALDNVVLSPHRAGHCENIEEERARHLAMLLGEDPLGNRVDTKEGY